jgi:histone-lysine N-methyltransferase EZH2
MEYVSLKNSILADNESKLLTRPYFGDDEPEERQDVLNKELPKKYDIKHDANALSDLRDEQCRFYFDAVNSSLADVGITWDMILFWLLSPDAVLQQINLSQEGHDQFETVIQDRSNYNKETFRRDKERFNEDKIAILFDGSRQWRMLLQQLKEPTVAQIRLAAVAGATILANCHFNPWYMAKQSNTMRQYVRSKTQAANTIPNSTFRSIACRICHE